MSPPGGGARADAPWSARYEPVVAVTLHTRLATRTKAFCNCAVDQDAEPNVNTCPVCLGLPGTLPVLNARAVDLGVRAALALGCTVDPASTFDRAHRLTPERPNGYRITQRERPLAKQGSVQIGETPAGGPILASITRAWLEEDDGRGAHHLVPNASAYDYNLAGAPLFAAESAPDLRSADEARAYVAAATRLFRLAGAGRAALDAGTLRVTLEVSVRVRGDVAAGASCRVLGAHSLDDVARAVGAEAARQAAVVDAGNVVEPRTMLWDGASLRRARDQRTDEDELTFPEVDLPPLLLTSEWIGARRDELPELPPSRRARLKRELHLDDESLDVLTDDVDLADYFESVARLHGDARTATRWTLDYVVPALARERIDARAFATRVRPADLAALLDMRRTGELTPGGAEAVFAVMAHTGEPARRVADREGLRQPVPTAG